MKQIIIALLAIFTLTDCQFFTDKQETAKKETTSKDGTFIKKRHFYDDPGAPVQWEISMKYKEGSESAIRHGLAKRYSKSGKLLETINYADNKKDGMRIAYHSTGKIFKEQPYKNGRLHGICKRYDRQGKLTAEYEYKDGLPGVGLKRYTNLGKLRPNPAINIRKTDNIRVDGTYRLSISLSGEGIQRISGLEFFEGQLIEGKYFHKNLSPLRKVSATKAELSIKLPKGSHINKTLNIVAKCKTAEGLLILQKPVTIDARGI